MDDIVSNGDRDGGVSSGSKRWMWVGLVVVVIAGGAAIGTAMSRSHQSSPPKPQHIALPADFVGTWYTHDGSVSIAPGERGELSWPGATAPIGHQQSAPITVTPVNRTQVRVVITKGMLVYPEPSGQMMSYGPGDSFTLTPTTFGLKLTAGDRTLFYFCTTSAWPSNIEYCGA